MAFAKEHGLWVLEDAAQSLGAQSDGRHVGTFGDAGAFSFFPGKNLDAFGDGGALATNQPALAEKVRMYRKDGARKMYTDHPVVGGTSRLHEFQAAVLALKFPFLKQWYARRRDFARLYREQLSGVGDIVLPFERPGNTHVYNHFAIRTAHRDDLLRHLTRDNIKARVTYPVTVPSLSVFSFCGHNAGDFPHAEKTAREILSLPIHHDLTEKDIVAVCDSVKLFFKRR
jgi:dTDP-4-amino-4,6-dideoxygalactose transaminase